MEKPKQDPKPLRFIDLREVERRTGLKRDSIYRLGRLGKMPRHVKVSEWASRWIESEIDEYVAKCIEQRDAEPVLKPPSRKKARASAATM